MNRRQVLRGGVGMGMTFTLGASFWDRVFAQTPGLARPGESPYGPLLPQDANGLMLPEGFTSHVVAHGLLPVPGTSYAWHIFPDGGACVPTEDGGWIYLSNSENPPPVDVPVASNLLAEVAALLNVGGKVSVIRFDSGGNVVDAYQILGGTKSNCAGGLTPWGTWLSCEEWEDADLGVAGRVWECDPLGARPGEPLPEMGVFKHEMAAADPVGQMFYLTEDQPDGLFYRFKPERWGSPGDLAAGGVLQAAVEVDPATGAIEWFTIDDAETVPVRDRAPTAKRFMGGEGVIYDQGRLYFTTKGDDKVWVHDIANQKIKVLYDPLDPGGATLDGVDNIIVSAAHELFVAEDGGNLEVNLITLGDEPVVAPVVRIDPTDIRHGTVIIPGIPTISEITGLALSPDGNRLYFNSMRADGVGILYEVMGPWRGGTLALPPAAPGTPLEPPAVDTPAPAADTGAGRTLPPTGGGTGLVGAGLLGAAGAALLRLRRRASAD